MSQLYAVVQQLVGWLHLLVSLAGVFVCATKLRRTPWAGLLLAGFAGEAVVSFTYRVLSILTGRGILPYAGASPLYMGLSFVGLIAAAAIVAGVAMVLGEVTRS